MKKSGPFQRRKYRIPFSVFGLALACVLPESCMKINEKLVFYLNTPCSTEFIRFPTLKKLYPTGKTNEVYFFSLISTRRASRKLPSAARAPTSVLTALQNPKSSSAYNLCTPPAISEPAPCHRGAGTRSRRRGLTDANYPTSNRH